MNINELIENAKSRANLPSDYALAKATGIPQNIISMWRKEKRHPSNEEAVKLATLAGLDEMRVIAEIELRTANNDKKRDFWKHYIESRGIAAVWAMATIGCGLMFAPSEGQAAVLQLQNYANSSILQHGGIKTAFDIIYIMRISHTF